MRRNRQSGFTLIEIIVSLAVIIIGLLGIMALQATTVRQNRLARGIERARVYAAQMMEDLRAKPASAFPASGSGTYPSIPTPDGVTYTRNFTIGGVTGSTGLVLITGTASFVDDADGTTHSATMQIVRTTSESL
jgi:prepilin-type N-terminal cleavage/methylation domain-containing protein